MRTLLFASFFCCISLSGQDVFRDAFGVRTGVFVNGGFWDGLSTEAKFGYVVGVGEGMIEIIAYAPKECSCAFDASREAMAATSGGKSSSFKELVDDLDAFFKDPANRAVPIIKALNYVTLKIRGASPSELEELAGKLRKAANR